MAGKDKKPRNLGARDSRARKPGIKRKKESTPFIDYMPEKMV